jgi:hypothetical protein
MRHSEEFMSENNQKEDKARKTNQSWIAALLILFISLPVLSILIGNAVNDAAHSNVSGEVYVDPLYQHVFKGTEAKEENALTGETYTANLGYTFASLTTESGTVNEAVVYKGTSTDTNVVIPTSYVTGGTTYTVIGVDYSGFANFATLASVTFNAPGNITLIDAQAFACCPALTKFNTANNYVCSIPLNLTELHSSAFYNDYSFRSLSFSNDDGTVTTTVFATIDDNAFNGCLGLNDALAFPDSLRSIGDSAFANCKNLPQAIMTTGVTSIGSYAFYDCSSLKIIGIPSTVTSIGDNAFRLCTKAKAYIGNAYRYSTGWPNAGNHATDSNDANTDYTEAEKTGGTCVVGDWNYASNSYAIPILVNMDAINTDATATYTYSRTWVPYDSTAATTSAAYNIGYFKVTIVSYLLSDATDVTIPETIRFISNDATKTTVMVNSKQIGFVTAIAQSAFANHTEITGNITVPNTCEVINTDAFNGCTAATSLTLGDGKKSPAINNCLGVDTPSYIVPSLSSGSVLPVVWAAGIDTLNVGTNASDYVKLSELTGLTTIADYAFRSSYTNTTGTYITSLVIPSTVQTIGAYAFDGTMQNLTTLAIAGASDATSDLKYIKEYAFQNVGTNVTSATCELVFPYSMDGTGYGYIVGDSAFINCNFIKGLYFKDQANAAGDGLEGTVADSTSGVNNINQYAFEDCLNLAYIYCGNHVQEIIADAFKMNSESKLCWFYGGSQTSYSGAIFGTQYTCRCVFYTGNNVSGWNIKWFDTSYEVASSSDSSSIAYTATRTGGSFTYSINGSGITPITANYNGVYYNLSGMYGFTPCPDITSAATAKGYIISDYDKGVQYLYYGSSTVITNHITYSYNNVAVKTTIDLSGFSSTTADTSGTTRRFSTATAIGRSAFVNDTSLVSIALPSTITNIDTTAFIDCTNLVNVGMSTDSTSTNYQRLPTNLTKLGNAVFTGTGITGIKIGASLNTISKQGDAYNLYAFWAMPDLAYLTVDSTNTTFCSDNQAGVSVGALYKKTSTTTTTLISITGSANTACNEVGNTTATTGCYRLRSDCTIIGWSSNSTEANNNYYTACATSKLKILVLDDNLKTIAKGGLAAINTDSDDSKIYFHFNTSNTIDFAPTLEKVQIITPASSALVNIYTSAFEGQTKITSLTLPSGTNTVKIYTRAFRRLEKLTSITFPTNVSNGTTTTTLATNLFDRDTSLETVTLPSTVTTIDSSTFYGCSSLARVNNTSNLLHINSNAFVNCTSLKGFDSDTTLTIPASLIDIGTNAFKKCTGLTSVSFANATNLTSIGDSAFNGDKNITSALDLSPDTALTSIGNYAFQNCDGVASVKFPSSLETIGTYAFQSCGGLTTADFSSATSLTSIGDYAFQMGTSKLTSLGTNSLANCTSLTTIGSYAFGGDSGLTSLSFPTSLKEIKSFAFNNNYGITAIIFPVNCALATLGEQAFGSVGKNAGLTSIDLSNCTLLSSLGKNLFANAMAGITGNTITLPNTSTLTSIPDSCFNECRATYLIGIGSYITSIGASAFANCPYLSSTTAGGTTFVIPNSVTSLGANAFQTDSALTKVSLGTGITAILANTFESDTSLTDVYINGSLASIATEAFIGCSSLKRTQTGSVYGISDIFVIKDSVTTIGANAFDGCTGLSTVYMGITATLPTLGTLIFNGCSAASSSFKVYFNHTYTTSGYDGSWNMGAGGSATTRVSVYWRSTAGGSTYTAAENTAVLTPGYAAGYFYFPTTTSIALCTLA